MKLTIAADCGNSPKKELLKNLTIYFVTYDLANVAPYLDEQITWTLVGDQAIVGRDHFLAALQQMASNKATELTIHSIVTHGREAALHGSMKMADGTQWGFADFYEFSSAKANNVKAISSYVVQQHG